jgi:hypothetical protein
MCDNKGFSVGDKVELIANLAGVHCGTKGEIIDRSYTVAFDRVQYHVPEDKLKFIQKKLRLYRITDPEGLIHIVRAYSKKNARKVVSKYLQENSYNYFQENSYNYFNVILSTKRTCCEYLGTNFNPSGKNVEGVILSEAEIY